MKSFFEYAIILQVWRITDFMSAKWLKIFIMRDINNITYLNKHTIRCSQFIGGRNEGIIV